MYSFGIIMLFLATVWFIAGFFARFWFYAAAVAFMIAWIIGLVGPVA